MTTPHVTSRLRVTEASVFLGDQVIARLRHAGRVITVVRADGSTAGRIMPEGYTEGRDDGSGRYEAWTAKHPMVHTPSDVRLGSGFSRAGAVEYLLTRRRAGHAS